MTIFHATNAQGAQLQFVGPQEAFDAWLAETGATQIADQPSASHRWNGSAWELPDDLELAREGAVLTKAEFAIALHEAGIMDAAEAEEAASGGWPSAFVSALSGMSVAERIRARNLWESADEIHRTSELLADVAEAMGVSDTVLDQIFSVSE